MLSIGVAVAILKDDSVLLTKREDFEVWCLPGGQLDENESMSQAAIREVYEETGLEVRLTRLVGIYSRPQWYGGHHIVLFAAEVSGGEFRPQPGEVIDIRYFPVHDLPDDLLLGAKHRILDAASGIGGSVAVCEDYPWAYGEAKNRQELYALRDQQANVPRAELYARFLSGIDQSKFRVEVG
jgi:ADP-ribose pyrophosphatase YjhB (NUDIX family)